MLRLMASLPSSLPALGLALLLLTGEPAALARDGTPPGIPSARTAIVGPPAEVRIEAAGPTREFRRAPDGLFYIDAVVNGTPVHFLVDTGASVVTLTPADARRVGVPMDDGHFSAHVETAGGKAAMAWTTLDHVTVAGRQVRQLRAAVVRDGLGVSLLGQNLLSQLASVTIEGDRLSLR